VRKSSGHRAQGKNRSRSSQKAHMKENLEIFDFKLDESDMKTISMVDLNKSQFPEWT
jgi:2,5-diketo-D-gluconate reductase A